MTNGKVARFVEKVGFSWMSIGGISISTGLSIEDRDELVAQVNAAVQKLLDEKVQIVRIYQNVYYRKRIADLIRENRRLRRGTR